MSRAINTALVHRNVDNDLVLSVDSSTSRFDPSWNITAKIFRLFDANFEPIPVPVVLDSPTLSISVPKSATENLESGRYVIRAMADKGGKYYLIGVLKIHVEDN